MATIRKKYPKGTAVTITATPKQGKRFDHWYAQTGTPFKGGTQPMSTENPVTITMSSKYRIQAFFEDVPNNSTSTLTLPERVDFSALDVNGNSRDFATFFKYYEPTPGYDVRDDLGGWGSMPAYSLNGRTTDKMVVHSKAKGIAFTPYLNKAIGGYSRIEASFHPESEYSDTFHVKLSTKGNIYMGDVIDNHGVYTSILGKDDIRKIGNSDEDKPYLNIQDIVLYFIPKDGKSLAEKLIDIPNGTFIGGINMVLYYGGVSEYHRRAAEIYVNVYAGKPEDLEVGEHEALVDLKNLWNRPNGFYINDNLEVDPKSANYNN